MPPRACARPAAPAPARPARMSTLVDSHCHLPLLAEADPTQAPETALAEARARGVAHLLCVSVDLESFPALQALAEAHAGVSCTVGVHPNAHSGAHSGVHPAAEPTVAQLAALGAGAQVVAIGETGLDYYRSSGDLGWQHERFVRHIHAALECGKPLVVHSREARADVVEVLRREGAARVGGVMHCFVDDWDTAERAMALGFYISLSGIVTFRNAAQVRDVARRVPLERLLVETDAPYLAPVPHRGKINRPAWVEHVAACVAELREMDPAGLAAATTDNFFRLFAHAPRPA